MSILGIGVLIFLLVGFVFVVIPDFIRLRSRLRYERRRREYMESTCIKLERPVKKYSVGI